MKFAHTQDQIDLRDGAREYLRGTCTAERLRELREKGQTNIGLWSELADLGLLGFLGSEAQGGLAMDAIGFSLIAEECGYVALPEPLVDSAGVSLAVVNQLVNDGSQDDIAAAICSGELKVLTAHSINPYVNQLSDADSVLTITKNEVRLSQASGCDLQACESIDPLRRLTKILRLPSAGKELAHGAQASKAYQVALNYGAVMTSAELLGLTARMIDMATDYAKDRQQFGKPIGRYQAVKHHLATALVKLEFARPCVYRAAADLASDSGNVEQSVAHAKIAANDAAVHAAEMAIQIHGGMGYTFEVDLHMWMKRAWALCGLWGDRNYHMNVIDKTVFESGFETGPAQTFV